MQKTSKFFADPAMAERAIRYESQYYDVIDLADILNQYDLGCRALHGVLEQIWDKEQNRIHPRWRNQKRKFFLHIFCRLDYLQSSSELADEWSAVRRDSEAAGHSLKQSVLFEDESGLDLYFKDLRLKILYLGTQDYIRIKLRTLLRKYGYQRRTKRLVAYMKRSFDFYGIQTYARGSQLCDIGEVPVDQYLTFRVEGKTF